MKTIRAICLVMLMALACSSCSTTNVYANRLTRVQRGMSKEDVKELFGKPDFVRFGDYVDEWEFRRYMPLEGGWSVVVIRYDSQELVEGMDTFYEPYVKLAAPHTSCAVEP